MDNRHVLEDDISVDARVRIAREVISNILIHRDYSNAFPAKLIIEKDQLRTENWSKSRFNGPLSITEFSPYPKNPLLASFFVNIGRADTLGSGMRNLYKYTKLYAHAEPILTEGDVFRIVIPFSSNALASSNEANVKLIDANHEANSEANSRELYDRILEKAESNPHITQKELADDLGVSRSTVQRAMDDLKEQKRLERIDGTRGYWKVNRK
ncbi:MAG: HTH domain-containing protein [Lachnospiraceae bacterium]|nr:HTH domain-containing protein [Lachnospiraceae bacterium]